MKERLAAFCLITSLIFTPALYAQTTPPVLTLTQQAFIKALCLTLLSSPDTPGEFLVPGLTADRFCEARVVDAFFLANWADLLAKHNILTLVAADNQKRIVVLETSEGDHEARLVALEGTTQPPPPPPPPPPPAGTELFTLVDNETGDLSQYSRAVANGTVQATQTHSCSGSWSLQVNKSAVNLSAWIEKDFTGQGLGSATTWSFCFYPESVQSTSEILTWRNASFNTSEVELRLNTDFTLTVLAQNVVLFSTPPLQQGQWTTIEVTLMLDDVNGSVGVAFNGTTIGSGSGDTFSRTINRVRFGTTANWRGQYEFFIDDFVGRE